MEDRLEQELKEQVGNLRKGLRETKIEIERSRRYIDSFVKSVKILRIRIENLENELINIKNGK